MWFWWVCAAIVGPKHFRWYVLWTIVGWAFFLYCIIH